MFSVLENHHVALAFQLTLSQAGANIFNKLTREEFSQIRQATVDMVLATDMSKHFEHLSKFSQLLGALPNVGAFRSQRVVYYTSYFSGV